MKNNGNISCLRQLLAEDSSRLISGEVHLKSSIIEWMKKDTTLLLHNLMHRYLDKIEMHKQMLEKFCHEEQLTSISANNRVISAFIEEVNEKLARCTCQQVRDACLLAGMQAINHFKISAYGTAAAFATAIGLDRAGENFYQAEKDEQEIDKALSHLARHDINVKALVPLELNFLS